MTDVERTPEVDAGVDMANEQVRQVLTQQDPLELGQVLELVQLATTGSDEKRALREHAGVHPFYISEQSFTHGMLVAIDTLVRAGLTTEAMPIDGLRRLATNATAEAVAAEPVVEAERRDG